MIFEPRLDPACREAQDNLPETPLDADRVRLHREHCESCREHARGIEEIKSGVEAADRPLDDLTRARIEARLARELDDLATRRSRRAPSLLTKAPWAIAAAAVLALFFVKFTQREPVLVSARTITPLITSGFESSGAIANAMSGAPLSRIDVPAGGRVDLEIGPAALLLIGAGELSSQPAQIDTTRISLSAGLLLADVEPTAGFVIEHAAAEVIVVGTRFAVDARISGKLVVAVSRGVVEVKGESVAPGRAWIEGQGLAAIPAELAAILERWKPQRSSGPSGLLTISSSERLQVNLQNGDVLGETPLRLRSAAGKQRFLIGGRSYEVEIAAGESTSLDATPPAPLAVDAPDAGLAPPPPQESAESLYKKAEQAMGRDDKPLAMKHLQAIVRRFPKDALAGSALYELARLNQQAGEHDRAKAFLEELLVRESDPSLAESAQHLLCRIETEGRQVDRAIECWITFRRRFSGSAHDRAALRALIGLAEKSGGCEAARPWLEEWIRSHPSDAFNAEAEERLERCGE